MNDALLSSKNMCWCTPPDFFAELDREFHFELDPASTDKSANIENGISNRQFRRANFISTNTSCCFVYHASSFGAMRENRESSAIPAVELEP